MIPNGGSTELSKAIGHRQNNETREGDHAQSQGTESSPATMIQNGTPSASPAVGPKKFRDTIGRSRRAAR